MDNPTALSELECDGLALESMWRAGDCFKIAPGTYVAELLGTPEGLPRTFTINGDVWCSISDEFIGFYPAMRQEFVHPGAAVRIIVVCWDPKVLPWSDFRDRVIGATDPSQATRESLRAQFRARWNELGLKCEPKISCNCVHASAGPLEGLQERVVWAGASLQKDELGKAVVEALGLERVREMMETNPVVTLAGNTGKVFDITECMDARQMLEELNRD